MALPTTVEEGIAEAIRLCGGAGFEAALFRTLQAATGADNLIVLAFRSGLPPLALFRAAADLRVFAQMDTTYLGGAYLLDPIHELHLNRMPAGAYRLADVAPDAFFRSRYYEEYYRQTTIEDEVCFLAYPRPAVTLTLCLARDGTSGAPFPARGIEACRRLAPVVVALAERHWAGIPGPEAGAVDVPACIIAALAEARGLRLSPRQAEVALLILRGHSTPSIALRLGLSAQTVKVFRRQIYHRCGISSQAELFALMLPLLDR